METIILASASARRQELIKQMGLPIVVVPMNIDEDAFPHFAARELAQELALKKLHAFLDAYKNWDHQWALAADTLIEHRGSIIGKPEYREDAKRMLRAFAGTAHTVYTGLALFNRRRNTVDVCIDETSVLFSHMSDEEMDWYLATDEWQGVAGGYRIQGKGACFIKKIEGSPSNVMGLPIHAFYDMLKRNNYQFRP